MANPTVESIIKQAQLFANDKAGTKYDQTSYLSYLNTGIQLLYQRHPSAFYVTVVLTAAPSSVGISDELAVLPKYADLLAHYVAAQCLYEGAAGDDEFNRKLAKDHMDQFISLSA